MVEIGQAIGGKYKVLRLLGDGGMGSVYEAEHLVLGTRVAIKVLHPELSRRAGLIDRFLQEARVSAQIKSAHVVQVTDVDQTPDGLAYLVMELLQGEPLSRVLDRERKLGVGTAKQYTKQILAALEAAHALGVVHRDLKPDNVFITFEAGRPVLKLIDFGIAKLKRDENAPKNLTVAGMLMGTPEYMAPEQAYSADKVDARADIYSVGVMLYEMLAGRTPAEGADPRVVVGKVERGEVTPLVHAEPSTPPELAGLVHRAMAPRPELRFANATEMRLALDALEEKKGGGTAELAAKAPAAAPGLDAAAPAGGTVMGAPVDAALLAAPAGGTMNAPPLGGSGPAPPMMSGSGPPPPMMGGSGPQPPMMGGSGPPPPMMTPAPGPRRPQKSNTGLVVGLGALALLLGAGAVVAYVYSTNTGGPSTPATFTIDPPPPTTPTTATPTVATVDPTPGTATPLTPGTNTAVVVPQNPTTRPPGSTRPPSTTPDAGATPPPLVFPSGLPSTLPPMPSTLPTFPLPSFTWPVPPPPPPPR